MASDVGEKLGEKLGEIRRTASEASAREYFKKKVVADTAEWCC